MSALIDDVSRIIASPIPRRQALRLLGGVVGGGVLASLGLGRASRALGAPGGVVPCGPGSTACGGRCCSNLAEQCCGGACVPRDHTCCSNGHQHHCSPGRSCCGGTECCKSGQACINANCCSNPCGTKTHAVCCGSHTTCCGTAASPICCQSGYTCCGIRCHKNTPSGSRPCLPV